MTTTVKTANCYFKTFKSTEKKKNDALVYGGYGLPAWSGSLESDRLEDSRNNMNRLYLNIYNK